MFVFFSGAYFNSDFFSFPWVNFTPLELIFVLFFYDSRFFVSLFHGDFTHLQSSHMKGYDAAAPLVPILTDFSI